MRKHLLLLTAILLICGLLFTAVGGPANLPLSDHTVKVHDQADLFTDDEELLLAEQIATLIAKHQMDVAVVTTDDAKGLSAMEYADDFYDYNGYGYDTAGAEYGTDRDGFLFLIDMDNREIYISTRGGVIGLYNDYSIERLLDAAYPYVSDGEYYESAKAFLQKADSIADSRTAYRGGNGASPAPTPVGTSRLNLELIGMSLLGGTGVALVVVLIMLFFHKRSLSATPHGRSYVPPGSIAETHRQDIFVNTYTTRTAIPQESSSSGGGGGGSSSHSSSSGGSHGGGGRSF